LFKDHADNLTLTVSHVHSPAAWRRIGEREKAAQPSLLVQRKTATERCKQRFIKADGGLSVSQP